MTLKNNRATLLSNIKLYASFHHHMWIQTWVTVRKRLSRVVTSVTLTFDLWPWPFAWTLLWSLVITPENFMMIRWWEHSQKGVTDRQTDRWTSFSMNKPTTWCKSGRVSLVSSSCLYKTQPERALAQVCHTRIDALSPDEFQFRRTENTICRAAWSQLKTIGHLSYAASSFVHHFIAIG